MLLREVTLEYDELPQRKSRGGNGVGYLICLCEVEGFVSQLFDVMKGVVFFIKEGSDFRDLNYECVDQQFLISLN